MKSLQHHISMAIETFILRNRLKSFLFGEMLMSTRLLSPVMLASIAGIGLFLSTLDSGIINIVLPNLMSYFNTSIATAIWTVTLYMLVLSTTILLWGQWADRYGRLKIYALGLGLFLLSSILCASANSIIALIIFRALQGLSAAMLQATAMALVTTQLDEQHLAKGMGILGILLSLGPMMGPVLGGLILSTLGWRYIFWLNIPFCLIGLWGCKKLWPLSEKLSSKPISYSNSALLAISLFGILACISLFDLPALYYESILGITILFSFIYILCERRSSIHTLPWSALKTLKFTAPLLGVIAFGGATAVAFMLPPLYLEKIKLLSPWQVGFVCLATPMGLMIASKVASHWMQTLSPLKLMFSGLILMSLTLVLFTQLSAQWSMTQMIVLLFAYGFGGGLYQIPCYLYLTKQFPAHSQAFISAFIRMIQNLAIAFEAAGAAILVHLKQQTSNIALLLGIRHAWGLSLIVNMIAIMVFSIFLFRSYRQSC